MIADAVPATVESFVERLLVTDDASTRQALIERHGLSPEEAHAAGLLLAEKARLLLGVDPLRMERISLDAYALGRGAGDEFVQVLARARYGAAQQALGRNVDACAIMDEAAEAFTRLGFPVEAARTRLTWVWAAGRLGRLTDALAAARAARRVLLMHGETFLLAALEMNTGIVLWEHGQNHAALRRFSAALALFRGLGETARLQIGRSHSNRGNVLARLGRYSEALTELDAARVIYLQMGEHGGFARTTRSRGEIQMNLGLHASALRSFQEAQATFRLLEMRQEATQLAQDLADCYLHLNRPADALAVLDEVNDDLERTRNPQDAFGVAARRVTVFLQLGERDRARQVMEEAERRAPAGDIRHHAWLATQRASLLLQDSDAEEALTEARRAHRLARSAGMRRLMADALCTQADALIALSQVEDAAWLAARACRTARTVDAAPMLYRARLLGGRVAELRGRHRDACRSYAEAIRQLEREQRGVIFAFRDSFAAGRGAAFERLAALQIAMGRPREALATAERAKSRALVDALSGVIELRPRRGASGQVRRLARELSAARRKYATACADVARSAPRWSEPEPVRAITAARLPELEAQIESLTRQLQLAGTSDDAADLYGPLTDVPVPSMAAGTLLIEFFFSGDNVLRFSIDASGVHGDVLLGAVPDIERLLRSFRVNLSAAEAARADAERRTLLGVQARALLGRLYDRLLGDLGGLDGCRSLVVVPHGLLHYLPFHALYDGTAYLVERMAISYAPSVALYSICRSRTARSARRRGASLVLAHSADGQLPYTDQEAEAVGVALSASVHREAAATRALLQCQGRRARLIHIAAHGEFRPDAPLFSRIELADGPLTTADVFSLDLRARLVTLSACETGLAVIGGGDELVGLVRAFLYAGAAGLVVSQWRVDDASTAALMSRFYAEYRGGAEPASALRTAQRAFLTDNTAEFGYQHPFYWAGFQFIGDDHGL